jgi:predicted NBD/HSP70 family sugar kinase
MILSLDVGGTSVKSGLVEGGRLVSEVCRTPMESQGPREKILHDFHQILNQYERFEGLAFAFPGPFDYEKGVCLIQGLEKYGELYGLNMKDALGLSLPTRFFNDAIAAIVGEARFGAGAGATRVLGVTLGTGLGSAFLVNGLPVTQGPGVPPNGWLYNQKVNGSTADDTFSIRGVRSRARAAGLTECEPHRVTSSDLWSEFGAQLGQFLSPFANDFKADALLVLGGLSGAFEYFGRSLNEALKLPAVPGKLGAAAPILGAAALFEDKFR